MFCPERLLWGPRRYGLTFRCTPLGDRFNASKLIQVLCCIDFFLLTLFTQMYVTFYAVLLFYLCIYLCFYAYVLCQKWRNKDVQSITIYYHWQYVRWPFYRNNKNSLFYTFMHSYSMRFNTLRPRQNGHHSSNDILKCIFLNENVRISLAISPKFVSRGPMIYIPALLQIMAWRQARRQAIIRTNDG